MLQIVHVIVAREPLHLADLLEIEAGRLIVLDRVLGWPDGDFRRVVDAWVE